MTELAASFEQVLHLGRVGVWLEERHFLKLVVRHRDGEAVAELADRRGIELLQLVRRILAFADLAEPESLDGLGEDHCRLAGGLRGSGGAR